MHNPIAHEQTHGSSELDQLSQQNIAAIVTSYGAEAVRLGLFASPEDAIQAVEARAQAVESDHRLGINMSADGIGRLFTVGSHETYWHAEASGAEANASTHNGKAIHNQYGNFRSTAENAMRQFVPEEMRHEHPRYAAIVGTNSTRKLAGPDPGYGNWWVSLDSSLEDAAVYSFSDSHASVVTTDEGLAFDTGKLLNSNDALTAQAVVELIADYHGTLGLQMMGSLVVNADVDKLMKVAKSGAGYVEAAIFDDITPNEVTGVGARILNDKDIMTAGRLFAKHPEVAARITSLQLGSAVPQAVKDWLKPHVKPDALVELGTEPEEAAPDALWDLIGLSPDADHQTIAKALHKKTADLWPEGDKTIGYRSPGAANDQKAADAWGNYIKLLKSSTRLLGSREQAMETFTALQQARLFFTVNPIEQEQ